MNVSFLSNNNQIYKTKQANDIKTYGKSKPVRKGVDETVLDKYTPFRRLSQKPCSLSDNEYFIDKFGKETKDGLPIVLNWDNITDEEKIDYIVKHRYKRLVANRLLSDMKSEQNEYNYMLGENGEIMALDIGDEEHVDLENGIAVTKKSIKNRIKAGEKPFVHIAYPVVTTTVHNHPEYYKDFDKNFTPETRTVYTEKYGIDNEKQVVPFSPVDILGDTQRRTDAYLTDSKGHRFHFIPKDYSEQSIENFEDFNEKAENIEKELCENYKFNKLELDLMKKRDKCTKKELKEKQFSVIDSYAQLLKEGIMREKYRELLKSDYFKENIGEYEEY